MNENLFALKEKKFWSSTSETSKHSPNIKGKVQKCYFTFKQKTLKDPYKDPLLYPYEQHKDWPTTFY